MVRYDTAETLSTHVAHLLREDILAAQWQPGSKLHVGQLSKRYDSSSTVVREALLWLAGDQLVQFRPNYGFFVRELTIDELADLTELRCRTEEFGVALAIERGDLAWESSLIAAHHTLTGTPRRAEDDDTRIANEWFKAHRAFHAKILEACGVPVLIDLAASLADATALYRIWAAQSDYNVPRDIDAEHKAILDAVLSRDAELAGKLLRDHYTVVIEVIRAAGLATEQVSDGS